MEAAMFVDRNKIPPSDFYGYILSELQSGSIDSDIELMLFNTLKHVEWVKPTLSMMDKQELNYRYRYILERMKTGVMPGGVLLWSAIYYNFTQLGLETKDMSTIINTSEKLEKESKILINQYNILGIKIS